MGGAEGGRKIGQRAEWSNKQVARRRSRRGRMHKIKSLKKQPRGWQKRLPPTRTINCPWPLNTVTGGFSRLAFSHSHHTYWRAAAWGEHSGPNSPRRESVCRMHRWEVHVEIQCLWFAIIGLLTDHPLSALQLINTLRQNVLFVCLFRCLIS